MTLKSTMGAIALCGLLAGVGSAEAMPVGAAGPAAHPTLIQKTVVVVTKRVVRRPRVIVRKTIVR